MILNQLSDRTIPDLRHFAMIPPLNEVPGPSIAIQMIKPPQTLGPQESYEFNHSGGLACSDSSLG